MTVLWDSQCHWLLGLEWVPLSWKMGNKDMKLGVSYLGLLHPYTDKKLFFFVFCFFLKIKQNGEKFLGRGVQARPQSERHFWENCKMFQKISDE